MRHVSSEMVFAPNPAHSRALANMSAHTIHRCTIAPKQTSITSGLSTRPCRAAVGHGNGTASARARAGAVSVFVQGGMPQCHPNE